MWHGCICKCYTEFQVCLIIIPYASIIPEYASINLNAPQYAWKWLNIADCLWICLEMPEYTVLLMPGFSICRDIVYNDIIIIVTNVIILEFLSTRFVPPGDLLPFYLF